MTIGGVTDLKKSRGEAWGEGGFMQGCRPGGRAGPQPPCHRALDREQLRSPSLAPGVLSVNEH